jgi:hypothetical protein
MSSHLLRSIKLVGDMSAATEDDKAAEMMGDARYIRHSSAIIHEALQKGFDVLQLANGDIVTTGTKIVSYRYRWDETKGRLIRVKAVELEDTAGEEEDSASRPHVA